jgi:membrane fusion protein (multidrug efflux system)
MQGVLENAILIPQQGVSRTPDGKAQVWLVGEDGKAMQKSVTALRAIGDKWLITEGLEAGDRVVVAGVQKLQPGVEVHAVEAGEDAQQPAGAPQQQGAKP